MIFSRARAPRMHLPPSLSAQKAMRRATPAARGGIRGKKPGLTDEQIEEIREAFNLFDTDHSGARAPDAQQTASLVCSLPSRRRAGRAAARELVCRAPYSLWAARARSPPPGRRGSRCRARPSLGCASKPAVSNRCLTLGLSTCKWSQRGWARALNKRLLPSRSAIR